MTVQQIVDVLNQAFAADPIAIEALCCLSVPCNKAIEDHPTITCGAAYHGLGGRSVLRLLGIINGISRIDGETIGASFDEKTGSMLGFCIVDMQPSELPVEQDTMNFTGSTEGLDTAPNRHD